MYAYACQRVAAPLPVAAAFFSSLSPAQWMGGVVASIVLQRQNPLRRRHCGGSANFATLCVHVCVWYCALWCVRLHLVVPVEDGETAGMHDEPAGH
jgi:hypothetical protein